MYIRRYLEGLQQKELIPQVTLASDAVKQEKKTPVKETAGTAEPFESKRRLMEQNVQQAEIIKETEVYRPQFRTSRDSQNPRNRKTGKGDKVKKEAGTITRSSSGHSNTQMELFDGKLLSVEAKKHHRIIGQIFDTYWLVQMEDKVYIIDQHAAHEKVLYERIVHQIQNRQVTSRLLSPPLIITLNLQEQEKMKRYLTIFQSLGFEMESFGEEITASGQCPRICSV